MEDARNATGNETPSDGELPKEETQAQETESREREQEPDWKRKYLEAKAAEEEANRLRRQLAELQTERQVKPATEREDRLRGAEEWAAKGDPVAQLQLEMHRRQEELERAIILRDQLRDVPEPLREAVKQRFLQHQDRFGDIKAAHDSVLAEERQKEIERLQAELKRRELNKPNPDVARTAEREVIAAKASTKEMTQAEWDAEQKALPMHEALKRQRELLDGSIRLK